jgi:septum formation protein
MVNLTNKYNIILGSKSPRRQELLKNAGFTFTVKTQDGDETFPEEMPLTEVAEYLSRKKAEVLKMSLTKGDLLITADSVVIVQDTLLNKPDNYEEAVYMLKLLGGQWHTVATGVCLTTLSQQTSFTSVTKVKMDTLSQEEMDYYIQTCQPFDKAGGYGIQDWIGLCKVSHIDGCYATVMGLPVRDLYRALMDFS